MLGSHKYRIENEPVAEEAEPAKEVDELVERKYKLMKEQREFLKNPEILNMFAVLKQAPEEKVSRRFDDMIEKIDNNTKALEEIKDTVTKDNIIQGLASGSYPLAVEFGKFSELNPGISEKNLSESANKGIPITAGQFGHGKIEIGAKPPSKLGLWADFVMNSPAASGILETLDHELIHHYFSESVLAKKTIFKEKFKENLKNFKDYLGDKIELGLISLGLRLGHNVFRMAEFGNDEFAYFSNKLADFSLKMQTFIMENLTEKFKKLEKKDMEREEEFKNYHLLTEILAQKAERTFKARGHTTVSLLDNLKEYYGYKEPDKLDMIISASQLIDRLRVLGFSDREIAEKLAKADYDKKNVSFPKLEKEIEVKAKKLGLSLEDIDTKADIARIERNIEVQKASIIAQKELKSFWEEEKALKQTDE